MWRPEQTLDSAGKYGGETGGPRKHSRKFFLVYLGGEKKKTIVGNLKRIISAVKAREKRQETEKKER